MTTDPPQTKAGRRLLEIIAGMDPAGLYPPDPVELIYAIEAEAGSVGAPALDVERLCRETLTFEPEIAPQPQGRNKRLWWRQGFLSALAIARDRVARLTPATSWSTEPVGAGLDAGYDLHDAPPRRCHICRALHDDPKILRRLNRNAYRRSLTTPAPEEAERE